MRASIFLCFLTTVSAASATRYPCQTITIFSLDMSNAVGTVKNKTLFHKQLDLISQAYHRWKLGFDDVRIGIPTPNGAMTGGSFELMETLPAIDDAITNIKYNDATAFQPSILSLQLEKIANTFFWSTEPEEHIYYNIVLFTGTMDAYEIINATRQRDNLFSQYQTRMIVVSLFPNQPQELQQLQTGGLIDINDVDFYFSLTNDVCGGEIAGNPTDIPTPIPVPAFPGNIDIFIQFSATGCPNPPYLNSQIQAIQALLQNFTFEENGVRAAVPTPIGMISGGNDMLLYNKENVLQTIKTIESFSKISSFCTSPSTVKNTLIKIESLLRIKPNSSAAMIFFSDSTDSTDISVAAAWRQNNLDPLNFVLIPVELPGAASLSTLATHKDQTFKSSDYNLGIEITGALALAQPFVNATYPPHSLHKP